jgi:putative peptidoglycan lipid II flippase
VILPSLSKSIASDDHQQFGHTLDWATRLTVLVGVPASIALGMISNVLMISLFEHGEFVRQDAMMSGLALQCLSGGILAFMLIKIFAPAFFARHDSRTPVKVGVISVIANVVLSLILAELFKKWQIAPHAGLGLANTLASFINAGLLYFYLHTQGIYRFGTAWRRLAVIFAMANGAMGLALAAGIHFFPVTAHQGIRIAALLALCVAGAVVYGAALLIAGFKLSELKPHHSVQ